MAPSHTDRTGEKESLTGTETEKDGTTGENADPTGLQTTRRSWLNVLGVAAAAAGVGAGLSAHRAAAAPTPGGVVDSYLGTDSEVRFPAGTYTWNGSGFDVGPGGAIIGDGEPGSVVFELEGGTMDGANRGLLQNVTVRGENPQSKAGIDVYAGCTFDGFVWPDGGTQNEDRAFYTPSGAGDGGGRGTFRNSAWAQMGNNGAYVDKIPHTFENCAALNNNVSGIRVGHRELSDPLSETTFVRNCLVANVADVPHDPETGTSNGRGVRLRHDAHLVVEDSFFFYKDVSGASYAIDVEDDCPNSVVEIRNCTFYNETDNPIIIDETGGQADITVENCVVAGPGSHEVAVDGVSDDAVTSVDSVSIPTPSALTGQPAADDVPGVEPGVTPWSDDAVAPRPQPDDGGDDEDPEPTTENTIVLHASPDNARDINVSFVVDGEASYGDESESDTDLIEPVDAGTRVTSVDLDPDALDSYVLTGPVIDYSFPDGASVDVSWNGTTTTFAELVDGEDSSGHGSSDDGSGGSDGDGSSDDGSSGSSDDWSLTNTWSIDGRGTSEATEYTFTVSGEVARDPDASTVDGEGTPWDRLTDIAREGKVIGVVGEGVDAYRFSGEVTAQTVEGDADVTVSTGQ